MTYSTQASSLRFALLYFTLLGFTIRTYDIHAGILQPNSLVGSNTPRVHFPIRPPFILPCSVLDILISLLVVVHFVKLYLHRRMCPLFQCSLLDLVFRDSTAALAAIHYQKTHPRLPLLPPHFMQNLICTYHHLETISCPLESR